MMAVKSQVHKGPVVFTVFINYSQAVLSGNLLLFLWGGGETTVFE